MNLVYPLIVARENLGGTGLVQISRIVRFDGVVEVSGNEDVWQERSGEMMTRRPLALGPGYPHSKGCKRELSVAESGISISKELR